MSQPQPARRPGWPEALNALIEQRRGAPFRWGTNDCALFAADAVLATTGQDPAAALRGTYGSAEGAARVLQQHGGVQALAAAALPQYPRALMARRGDVVCVPLAGRPTLGVVAGNGCWCSPGERGLEFRPMAEVALAFQVGA